MSVTKFFDLTIPAPKRLEMMREAFKQHPEKYPRCPEHAKPKSWRDVRGTTHAGLRAYIGALSRGFNDGAPVWYTHGETGLRDEKTDSSYFTNSDYSGKARGLIVKLPHGRYLAGYYWTENGESVIFQEIYKTREDAEAGADYDARKFADCALEDSQRYEAMVLCELDCEEKKAELERALYLRHVKKFGGMERARQALSDYREAKKAFFDALSDYEGGN